MVEDLMSVNFNAVDKENFVISATQHLIRIVTRDDVIPGHIKILGVLCNFCKSYSTYLNNIISGLLSLI